MKDLTKLKNTIKNYFNYMYEDKSEDEIANYTYDSFLDFSSFLDEMRSREFLKNINLNDFSDDELYDAYCSAIDELLENN